MTAARFADDFAVAAHDRNERVPWQRAAPRNAGTDNQRTVHTLIRETQRRARRLEVAVAGIDDLHRDDELADRRGRRSGVIRADAGGERRLQPKGDLAFDQDPIERAARKCRRTRPHATRRQRRSVRCRRAARGANLPRRRRGCEPSEFVSDSPLHRIGVGFAARFGKSRCGDQLARFARIDERIA
jgi:hypothetical protein